MNVDKLKTAVALGYDENDKAPQILASGKGHIAEKIIEAAKESDVPLYEDAPLAESLSGMEIGDEIPPEMYEIVAKILVYVGDRDRMYAMTHK